MKLKRHEGHAQRFVGQARLIRTCLLAVLVGMSVAAQATVRTWTGVGANALASTPANWVDSLPPVAGDSVLFTNSTVNCTWDLDIEIEHWTQASDYSGTVTIRTKYPDKGAIQMLSLTGNALLDGGAWTHPANSGGASAVDRLAVTIGGNLTVGSNAAINVNEKGYAATSGPGAGQGNVQLGRGASHGGLGGPGNNHTPWPTYGCPFEPLTLGSGASRPGGGSVWLSVGGTTRVDGSISATAQLSNWRYPGSAGGSIFLTTGSLEGEGSMVAAGRGAESTGDSGGSGSGGRIAVVLTGSSGFGDVTIRAPAGKDNSPTVGASGTVYLQTQTQSKGEGTLIIDNNPHALSTAILVATMMPNASAHNDAPDLSNLAAIIVTNNARLGLNTQTVFAFGAGNLLTYGTSQSTVIISGNNTGLTFPDPFVVPDSYTLMINGPLAAIGDWTVPAGVTLSHFWNHNAQTHWLELTLVGDLTIEAGAAIDVTGRGYSAGQGPGGGTTAISGYGGSHGGMGGVGRFGAVALNGYGSVIAPTNIGSGAYNQGNGAIRLDVSGTTTLHGNVLARNTVNTARYGGTPGGAIWLRTGHLLGSGLMDASGKPSSYTGSGAVGSGGGGGGGRISVALTEGDSFDAVEMRARGGPNTTPAYVYQSGAAGTIYTKTQSQGSGRGQLLIANDNRNMGTVTNTLTWLPAPSGALAGELAGVTLVISNQSHVALSSNLTIGDLFIRQDTPNFLYLKGHTLKVNTFYHRDWGDMETNVIADGGEIQWLSGTLILVR